MQLTVVTEEEGRVVLVDLDAEDEVNTLHAILEVETGVPAAAQRLTYNQRPLRGNLSLGAQGVGEGDLIVLSQAALPQHLGAAAAPTAPPSVVPGSTALLPDGSAADPGALMRMIASQPEAMAHLPSDLAAAVRGSDTAAFQTQLRQLAAERRRAGEEEARFARLAAEDPFNPEVQARLEEAIRQKNVVENFEAALEHNPEAFGSVTMLYVSMEVAGTPLKAFVDSGAQMTIMSKSCAARCGLLRLMDTRWQGTAVGVGSATILGEPGSRIHMAPLKAAGHHLAISITVLDQEGMDFLFGLDNLRRHLCCIDLKAGVLRFGSTEAELPFLPEHEVPKQQLGGSGSGEGSATTSGRTAATMPPAGGPQGISPRQGPASAPGPGLGPTTGPQTLPTGWEEKLAKLADLGFNRAQSLAALQASAGNEDVAASMLFSM